MADLEDLVGMGILLVLAVGAMLGLDAGCSSMQCHDVERATGKRTEYRVLTGCYVEVGGKMIPLGSWRGEQEPDG